MRRWFLSQETELLRYSLIPRLHSANVRSNYMNESGLIYLTISTTNILYIPPLRVRFLHIINLEDVDEFFLYYKDDFSFDSIVIPQVEDADEETLQVNMAFSSVLEV